MTILKQSKEFDDIQKYEIIVSPDSKRLKDIEGTVLITDFVEYEDEKEDGSVNPILSIQDEDGNVYKGQSPTFKRSFYQIVDLLNAYPLPIKIICGKSKSDREYIDCILDTKKLREIRR